MSEGQRSKVVQTIKGAEASGSGQWTGHDWKKAIGLQEYQDRQQGQGKATSAATTFLESQEEEDWDKDLSLPQPAPECGHFVTQLNQDPGDSSTADSGLGTIAIEEEDAKADTARDEEVKGGDGEAAIDVALNANATDKLVWNNNDPYFEIDDESSGVHRTLVAALTPLLTPTEETVLLPPASLGNEKLCREIPAVEPESINASTPDYSDVPLVGFTRPDLSRVFPWVKFELQDMCEPPWRTELAQIQKDEEIRYITIVFTWFQQWRIRRGVWPLLPQSEFNLSKEMRDRVDSCLTPTLAMLEMLMAEMQALKILITLQCIAEVGPRKPTPGYICQCMESIMRPLSVIGITFSAHSVLASAALSLIQEYLSWNRHFLGWSVIAAIQCGVGQGLGSKGRSGSWHGGQHTGGWSPDRNWQIVNDKALTKREKCLARRAHEQTKQIVYI